MFVLAGAFVVPPAAGVVWFSPPLQPVKTAHVTRPNSAIRAMILFIGECKFRKKATKDKQNLQKNFRAISKHLRSHANRAKINNRGIR